MQGSNSDSQLAWRTLLRAEVWGLVLVLGSALALRLRGLSAFPFWEDELYSIAETTELFWSRAADGIFARPLYFLLMNGLTPVLPQTSWGLRIPALAFGLLSIGLAWRVARGLGGPWAGILTAVAVSLAPGHIFISTSNRYWSLVFLEGLAFTWLALRALEADDPKQYRRALVVLLVGAATHPLFLAAVAAIGLGSCLSGTPPRLRWRWPTPKALLSLWLPALGVLLLAYGLIAVTQGARQVTQIGGGSIDLMQRLRIVPAIAFGLTPIVAVGCLMGAWRLRLSERPAAHGWAVATLAGTPASLAVLLALSGATLVTAIYASALTPLFFVSFGGLCAESREEPGRRAVGPMLLVLTVAAMLPSTISQLADGGRFDFRPAFERIRRTDPSLPVVLTPVVQARHYAPELRRLQLSEDGNIGRLRSLRQSHTQFWLLLNERRRGISFDFRGEQLAFAQRYCEAKGEFGRMRLDYQVFRIRLFLCDR